MSYPMTVYYQDPFIAYYENILSSEECQGLIDMAGSRLQPSNVVYNDVEGPSDNRKSEQTFFPHMESEFIYRVSSRIAELVQRPLSTAQSMQVVRYTLGGKFDAHTDTFDPKTPLGNEYLKPAGQRRYTALLYLNTVSAGGETYFPYLNLEIKPTEGNLLVFQNCKNGTTEPHQFSIHGSRPVTKGEKWIATLWFCERPHY